ncbi:MAG: hypothetical protein IT178_15885 [Acidobacteria bacterium]|nr:hypothetical protein [Acidobacteriota bacterium]
MLVPHELVRAELDRLLASDDFINAERLSRLLRFLVERTLDGRDREIKEFVVGTEVFDRGPAYDPRLDSIVRVEMRRLRTKLDEHYGARVGDARPVNIRFRKGSYVPLFVPRGTTGGDPLSVIADEWSDLPDAEPHDGVPGASNGRRDDQHGSRGDQHDSRGDQHGGRGDWSPTGVSGIHGNGAAAVALSAAAVVRPAGDATRTGRTERVRRPYLLAAALFLAVVATAGATHLWRAPALPRLAVLPFETLARDAELETIASTLTGEVTSALVQRQQFDVVPRRSAAAFPSAPRVTAETIAALRADWLVEAMVHRLGAGVRAEVRLVDATRDRKVWVEDFVGTPADLQTLATRIAERMGEQVAESR